MISFYNENIVIKYHFITKKKKKISCRHFFFLPEFNVLLLPFFPHIFHKKVPKLCKKSIRYVFIEVLTGLKLVFSMDLDNITHAVFY